MDQCSYCIKRIKRSLYIDQLVVATTNKPQDDEIVKRLSGRRVHLDSGRVYHIIYNPPEKEGLDDVSGDKLIQREDDQEETVRSRLKLYHEQTKPLVDFYTKLSNIDGNVRVLKINGLAKVDSIKEEIFKFL